MLAASLLYSILGGNATAADEKVEKPGIEKMGGRQKREGMKKQTEYPQKTLTALPFMWYSYFTSPAGLFFCAHFGSTPVCCTPALNSGQAAVFWMREVINRTNGGAKE